VISPLFFPGGDIGSLAVHGTVNDVAMCGARPLYLAAGFILEEGLPLADLARIVESMARACNAAGVPVVTGDTKVVERGKGDGCFITTTGVGVVPDGIDISGDRAGRAMPSWSAAASATTAWPSCPSARTSASRPRSAPTPRRCTTWSPP
jgi:hydrogenase expression/formation protein HypE